VFRLRDGLEVPWSDTELVLAAMMNLMIRRDWANERFVDEAMGDAALVDAALEIAIAAYPGTHPIPAVVAD